MANLVLSENGSLLEGTPDVDSIAFGIYIDQGVPFTAAGTILAGAGNDDIFTLNPDALQNGVQLAYAQEGDDNIRLSNLYIAYGGQGNDSIQSVGRTGPDTAGQQIFGGQGNDTISAGGGNDNIEGNQGSDIIDAGDDLDFVLGGQDNDSINGGAGNDAVYGNRGNDTVFGGTGSDLVHGGAGDDRIQSSSIDPATRDVNTALPVPPATTITTVIPENDTIIGGAGLDTLTGGGTIFRNTSVSTGGVDDLFRYEGNSSVNVGVTNIDYITNFQGFVNNTTGPFVLPDKISLATGADAVLGGLNFTSGTTYDLNQVQATAGGTALGLVTVPIPSPELPNPPFVPPIGTYDAIQLGDVATYDQAIGLIQAYFAGLTPGDILAPGGTPVTAPTASSSTRLQVYNFELGAASTGQFADDKRFLFINNGDTVVSSTTDMFIQGVAVGGANTNPANSDIIFG